jgi:hypothetical protein
MNTLFLPGYLSRSQIRSYLEFIQNNGVEAIVETRDGLYHDNADIGQLLAGSISSIKEFHLARFFGGNLPKMRQLKCELSSDGTKPQVPEESKAVGIFYMSRLNKDFTASQNYTGDVGDVLVLSLEDYESYKFDTAETGTNNQLTVFWG